MGAYEALCWVKWLLERLPNPPKQVLDAINEAIDTISKGVATEFAYKHGLKLQLQLESMAETISNSNRSLGKKEHREY